MIPGPTPPLGTIMQRSTGRQRFASLTLWVSTCGDPRLFDFMAHRRLLTRQVKTTLVALVTVALACGWTLSTARARARSVQGLQQHIRSGETQASGLAQAVGAGTQQINSLGAGISSLQDQISQRQALLTSRLDSLHRTQAQSRVAHTHLLRLEASAAHAAQVLRRQMVGRYEIQQPDVVTIILNANGFQQLLERIGFAQRIEQQDARVVKAVRGARRAVALEAVRLGTLEVREQKLAAQILADRNSLSRSLSVLIARRTRALRSRAAAAGQLIQTRSQLAALRGQLAHIRAAQAAAARAAALKAAQAARAAAQARSTPAPAAPASAAAPAPAPPPAPASSSSASSGGFTFPLPAASVTPPSTWTLDDGVDMAAPGGTPEYAVCSGTIVLHGIGGFGPWAPVLHCDSPVGGYSYVYYGHAGPANQLPVGTHVAAGQVMSEIGPGIVGLSSGPHIEIGFCDASGTPLGPGTASTMMSLLNASFHG